MHLRSPTDKCYWLFDILYVKCSTSSQDVM